MQKMYGRWGHLAIALIWTISWLLWAGVSPLQADPHLQVGVEAEIAQALTEIGIQGATVTFQDDTLTIGYLQPPIEFPEEIPILWVRIFDLAADKAPGVGHVVLDISLTAGARTMVRVAMADIEAYLSGLTTVEAFLASLEVGMAEAEVEEGLLFEDDFSDPQHAEWDIYSDKDAKGDYEAGQYSVLVKKENWIAWGRPGQRFTDFALEVEASQVAGPTNNNYGVLVRYQDCDNFYYFRISGNGYYSVWKREAGEWSTLVAWTQSPHIRQGQSTNRLLVICEGSQMSFYVNGQHLVNVTDGAFSAGDIALAAGAFDQPGVHIRFDNLRVSAPAGFGANRLPMATPTPF